MLDKLKRKPAELET